MSRLALLAICMATTWAVAAAEELPKTWQLMPPGYMTKPSLNADDERIDPSQKQLLTRQYEALSAIPDVRVRYSPNGTPYHVEGNTGMHFNRIDTWKPGDRAPEVLEELRDLLTAQGTEELRVRTVQDARKQNPSMRFSKSIVRFDQYIRGIPVRYAAVILNLDPETAELQYLSSTFLPDRGLPQTASITSTEAKQIASQEVGSMIDAPGAPTTPSYPEPELMYVFDAFVDGRPAGWGDLAWIIHITREVGGFPEDLRVVVSATTGRPLEVRPSVIQ